MLCCEKGRQADPSPLRTLERLAPPLWQMKLLQLSRNLIVKYNFKLDVKREGVNTYYKYPIFVRVRAEGRIVHICVALLVVFWRLIRKEFSIPLAFLSSL